MVIVHYAGISKNNSSGVSVIVPQIINAQARYNKVGLYNFGDNCFSLDENVKLLSIESNSADYVCFPSPFNKPDIVVFHSPFGILKSIPIAKKIKENSIKYVIVPHGCFSKNAMDKKKIKKILACKFLFRDMFKNVTAIQYLSNGEQRDSVIKEPYFIVPNGVEVYEKHSDLRDNSKFVITYIGRKSIYHKGLDILIKGCGLIRKELQKNNMVINIYGPSEKGEEETLQQMIRTNNLQGIVNSYDGVFGKEKEKILRETNIFVLTSRSEGLPGAVLEAWMQSCPTLLTQGTNLAEEAESNMCGWKVEGSPNSIAEGIMNIYKKRNLLCQYGDKAYNYVRQNYAWDAIGRKYDKEYKRLIEND